MKKQARYKIIGGNTLSMLEDEVNKEIKKGYLPVGGVFSYNSIESVVFQAMLRDKP